MMNRLLLTAIALTTCTLLGTSLAHAQATRTWVSGTGDDANPCSLTAPCKTFAGAISKTATAGEISVLDPGGYGALTITKSITINGEGTLASVVVAGTSAILINADNAVVTLRNLSLLGVNNATIGVRFLNGTALIVERLSISGFSTAAIEASEGNTTVINSTLTGNSGFGVHALGGSITVENSLLANNGVAVQAETGATIRLSNNGVYNNLTGFGCGGTLASAGNNRKANNVGGVVPVCSPNAAVTVQ